MKNLFLLCVALFCPVIAQAQHYDAASGLYYQANGDGTAAIVNYAYGFSGAANIPATIGGLSVTAINSDAFYGCSGMTSVTIPDSVTTLGDGAFTLCTSLTNATLGNGITSISYQAFFNCYQLRNVPLNTNVTDIGFQSFYGCTNVLNVIFPNSLTTIEGGAFGYCYGLTNITIPSGVTSVGDAAFEGCRSLTVVYFVGNAPPENSEVFRYTLATVYYQPGTTGWGSDFSWAPTAPYVGALTVIISPSNIGAKWGIVAGGLTNNSGDTLTGLAVTNYTVRFSVVNGYFPPSMIPTTVTLNTTTTLNATYTVNPFIFTTNGDLSINITGYNGPPTANLVIPKVINGRMVASIGDEAFYNFSTLTNVTIPNSVISIGESAFDTCSSLVSVTIPNSVNSIGGAAFSACVKLTSITLSTNLTDIADSLFTYDSALTNVVIPNGIMTIENNAFGYCAGLTSVTIPSSVSSIGTYAFGGCSSLTAAYFIGNAPPDNNTAFQGTPATIYYQPRASGWYSYFGSAPTAALVYAEAVTATITPNNIGAKWAIDGGAFTNNSGDLITGLATVNHTITFSPVSGYATPPAQTFSLPINTTNVISALYWGIRIGRFTLTNGVITLDLLGRAGDSHQIQVSTDLSHWTTVGTLTASANGIFQFIDANPPQPSAYYRLKWIGN